MEKTMNEVKIANLNEKVNAISDFLRDFYSVRDLYQTAADAASVLMYVMNHKLITIPEEEKKHLQKLYDQHILMIDLIKDFEIKEGEL